MTKLKPRKPVVNSAQRRDAFWQNVVRDMLTTLSVAAGSGGRLSPTASGAASSPDPVDEMFDGRLAVITSLGQRIPIADIYPVFACSLPGSAKQRALSGDVQCTVFRIETPSGEAYTLPLSQIVSLHSLSADLVAKLEEASVRGLIGTGDDLEELPFGFAAFTSLAQVEADEEDDEEDETDE